MFVTARFFFDDVQVASTIASARSRPTSLAKRAPRRGAACWMALGESRFKSGFHNRGAAFYYLLMDRAIMAEKLAEKEKGGSEDEMREHRTPHATLCVSVFLFFLMGRVCSSTLTWIVRATDILLYGAFILIRAWSFVSAMLQTLGCLLSNEWQANRFLCVFYLLLFCDARSGTRILMSVLRPV